MLYGRFAEATKPESDDESWIVELPDDDAESMKVFLDIAHCHFQAVPKSLSLDQLYKLTVLTNYYDCTVLLSPWIELWVTCFDDISKTHLRTVMPKVLWISWELGLQDILDETARRMLMEFDGQGFVRTCEEENIQTPPDIVGKIEQERK